MLKQTIKKIIGPNNVMWIKQHANSFLDFNYLRDHPCIQVEANSLLYQKFAQKGKHVFFGYYDISQFDETEKKLLVHVVDKKADAKKDVAEIGYYNLESCEYNPFALTHAWCWQQGARLRWATHETNIVLFNDVEGDHYVTREYDILKKKEEGCIDFALYDISPDMTYGLSLNFSRLQRLRPGYGYSTLPDETVNIPAPDNDGIFYINLETGSKELLISLEELAEEIADPLSDQHYINHISISPDGEKFMFFHIWTIKEDTHWKTRLCIYDFETQKVKIIEDQDRVSHYDWINDHKLLVTCWDHQRSQYYCIYDTKKGSKEVLNREMLCHDGHPSVLSNEEEFISDTYPMSRDMQTLFEYNLSKSNYRPIIQLYSDPLQYEEKRCDLHPRLSKSERYITLDTTCENHCRQVLLLRNWRE